LADGHLNLGDLPEPLTLDVIRGIIFTATVLLIGGLIAVQIHPLAHLTLNIIGVLPLIKRLHAPLTEFYESSSEIFKLQHVIPTTIMGLGVYASSTIGFVIILWGFDLTITFDLVAQVALIVGVVSAIGALSFTPNGAGVTELSNLLLLSAIVAPNHPELTPGVAGAAALMQGFFHKWFRVLLGIAVAFTYRKRLFTSELESELIQFEQNKNARQQLA
jgi:hypothetical protein